jgi:hypothetical protein
VSVCIAFRAHANFLSRVPQEMYQRLRIGRAANDTPETVGSGFQSRLENDLEGALHNARILCGLDLSECARRRIRYTQTVGGDSTKGHTHAQKKLIGLFFIPQISALSQSTNCGEESSPQLAGAKFGNEGMVEWSYHKCQEPFSAVVAALRCCTCKCACPANRLKITAGK